MEPSYVTVGVRAELWRHVPFKLIVDRNLLKYMALVLGHFLPTDSDMPKRNILPFDSDSNSHSDVSSVGWPPRHYTDNESYDKWGQANGGGIGQGAPHDEHGCYIYSQVGMPVIPSSPLASLPKVDEGLQVSDCTTNIVH